MCVSMFAPPDFGCIQAKGTQPLHPTGQAPPEASREQDGECWSLSLGGLPQCSVFQFKETATVPQTFPSKHFPFPSWLKTHHVTSQNDHRFSRGWEEILPLIKSLLIAVLKTALNQEHTVLGQFRGRYETKYHFTSRPMYHPMTYVPRRTACMHSSADTVLSVFMHIKLITYACL